MGTAEMLRRALGDAARRKDAEPGANVGRKARAHIFVEACRGAPRRKTQ